MGRQNTQKGAICNPDNHKFVMQFLARLKVDFRKTYFVCVRAHMAYVQEPVEDRRGCQVSAAGALGGCESQVGSGN